MNSLRAFLSCASEAEIRALVDELSENAVRAMPYLFELWALDHQIAPEGDWATWLVMGGRGAGKTRAGAEWIRAQVEGAGPEDPGLCRRVALVGETYAQARDVMVLGDSGLIACSPEGYRPKWVESRRTLVWPNGAEAQVFSAHDADALRGPQFHAAWCDELAKWPNAQMTWDMLQFALRLGEDPRAVVTTTPQPTPLMTELLDSRHVAMTHAATSANAANLAPTFLKLVTEKYGGTALGRQELDGEMIEDMPDALWPAKHIREVAADTLPDLQKVVVALDPPVSAHEDSDACGIIVAGQIGQGGDAQYVVLDDATVQGASTLDWARQAVAMVEHWRADYLVAEVNQGGDLVAQVLRQVHPGVPLRTVHASRGKVVRAAPVALLYERGQVRHAGRFTELEDQMRAMGRSGFKGKGSPDRVDALVWALSDLMQVEAVMPRARQL
ncbi:hypothetical protein POI8812_01475 [Pontivivens insulae]|uniref:Terminase large subunit gp17-like C-terminal domain-containing protein n=2 Tax=Pontivivens insulae TaxID=1639689 RepID=A0A2R8AAQ2_9RHOB|nr:terminase family protein [Pontivivens insulae]RED13076.1 phage terminase large subunit-like protein [Pontivivens insulae]SPF29168.1 hypothetical protein POI8812_01475 [Pontivivens insulae]